MKQTKQRQLDNARKWNEMVRKHKSQIFSLEAFKVMLRENGLHYGPTYTAAYIRHKELVTTVGKNRYQFTSQDRPIYYEDLQTIMMEAFTCNRKRNNMVRHVDQLEESLKEAYRLLTANGYHVFKKF